MTEPRFEVGERVEWVDGAGVLNSGVVVGWNGYAYFVRADFDGRVLIPRDLRKVES
jgi:hypothetical protein